MPELSTAIWPLPCQQEGVEIVALDPSSTAIGWVAGDQWNVFDSGVFVPKGHAVERLIQIWNWLYNWYPPVVVGFEIPRAGRRNPDTDRLLGAVEYAIRVWCYSIECHCVPINPSTVKATGLHKDALLLVEKIKGAPLDRKHPGDEADAFGVWHATVARWKQVGQEKLADAANQQEPPA